MTKVVRPFHEAAFDPETVKMLCEVCDRALESAGDAEQPSIVEELIVYRIIMAAKLGERDPDKLCAAALKGTTPTKSDPS